ncbi:MAG: hypothetical protein O2826_06750 [Chloroflexi bacterium]|nr:hypothetical protein [Chloroflexota bacterium]MDA1174202.1 hypothetical protein [Chloroflexota bacterium]
MTDASMFVWISGTLASPVIAFLFADRYARGGAFLLGLLIATASFGLAMLLSTGACEGSRCPSSANVLVLNFSWVAAVASASVQGVALYRMRRARLRRVVLGVTLLLAVPMFIHAILVVRVVLILIWWGVLGWLVVKDPPLRLDEVTRSG